MSYRGAEWYERSLDLATTNKSKSELATATGNIGNVYMEKDEPGKALVYFREAQQHYQRNGDHVDMARMACNIDLALLKDGRNREIQATLKQLDNLDMDLPDVRITQLLIRARSMVDDGQHSDAVMLYDEALHVAHEHGLLTYEAEVHQDLRELARQRNDLDSYIEHNDTFLRINNEVKGAEVKTRLAIQAKDKEMRIRLKQRSSMIHSTDNPVLS